MVLKRERHFEQSEKSRVLMKDTIYYQHARFLTLFEMTFSIYRMTAFLCAQLRRRLFVALLLFGQFVVLFIFLRRPFSRRVGLF